MAKGNRRDLYLSVNGDIRGLQASMTAGKTVINEFGGAAINVIEEVEKEMAKLGASGLPNLKKVEDAYTQTFKRIAASARDVGNAPDGNAAAQILDANATREAAAAATAKANSLRILAEAAQRADAATNGGTAGTRAYAVAAATAAVEAEREANALREQAQVLGLVERELGTAGAAQRRIVAVSGEARAGYQQLSYQLGDIATQYASGTAASIIFAQQSGQVIQAISLINGEAKGFIGFLGGPWGIALSSALVVATPWVAKLLEGNDALADAIKKLREDAQQTDISRQAHAAFMQTIEGQIDAQRRLNEEMERGLKTQREINRENLQTALKTQTNALKELADAEKSLTEARRKSAQAWDRVRNPSALDTPEGAEANRIAAEIADRRLREAQAKLDALKSGLQTAQQGVRDARIVIAAQEAKAAVDPIAAIGQKYDDLAQKAINAAKGNDQLTASLKDTLTEIERQRAGALKAEQERQSADRRSQSDVRNGRLTPNDVGSMLKGQFGGTVTSTTGGKHVPNSYHYRGQAVDFVPKDGMGSVSKAEIRSYLESQGIRIEELLGPGDKDHNDHFHVAFSKSRRSPEGIRQAGERAEDRATRNADEYSSLLSRVKGEQLQIERSRVQTIEQAAQADIDAVRLAQADLDRAAEKGVSLGKWTQAEADAVKIITASNAESEIATIKERERVQLVQRQIDAELAGLDGHATLLQLQGDLATTAEERRRIARQLLWIEEQEERLALQRRLEGERDPTQRSLIQGQIDGLDVKYGYKQQISDRRNAGPFEQYQRETMERAANYSEELEKTGVRFFDNLNDQLSESATRFLKLKGAAGEFFNQLIADVIRLNIQQAAGGSGGLIGGLLKFVGGGTGGGGGSDIVLGGGYYKALGKGFSLGGYTGDMDRSAVAGVVHGQEFVFDADAVSRIGRGPLEALRSGRLAAPSALPRLPSIGAAEQGVAASQGAIRIEVVGGELFEARVAGISGRVSAQVVTTAAPTLMTAATSQASANMSRQARRTIR